MRQWQGLEIEAEGTGISEPLSQQVNLLGTLLGHVIREQAGDPIFEIVEKLRLKCKAANLTQNHELFVEVQAQIQNLNLDEIVWIIRSFTTFFHLINEAQRQDIIRKNRERHQDADLENPRKKSILAAVSNLNQKGVSFETLIQILENLDIQPTLTAHPTEARRHSVLEKQNKIAQSLSKIQLQGELSEEEQDQIFTDIYHQIALLVATDDVRSRRLTVPDEVRNVLYFCTSTIWEMVPRIYHDLQDSVEQIYNETVQLPVFFKYRSWIGGDRDGNPFVTPEITESTLTTYKMAALRLYLRELIELRHEFSISSLRFKIPEKLIRSIEIDMKKSKHRDELKRRYRYEPYRLKISFMIEKLNSKLKKTNRSGIIYSVEEFLADLELLKKCIETHKLGDIAQYGLLSKLIIQTRVFGFHLISLDLRQHCMVHKETLTELFQKAGVVENYKDLPELKKLILLESELLNPRPLVPRDANLSEQTVAELKAFEVLRKAVETDRESIGSYIISMTHNVSDLLEVLLLAKEVGLWYLQDGIVKTKLDVVPLFETIEGLRNAENLLRMLFSNKIYKLHLEARSNFQEIMLGYSDSNKDGGYWMANLALQRSQELLAQVCIQHNVTFRFFHGRGGTVARGGGRANQAIFAMPSISQNGKIRFTEQGEVISFRYSQPLIARRHLEEIVDATLETAFHKDDKSYYSVEMMKMMEEIARRSRITYRQLIDHPDFWQWFKQTTPLEPISQLPIASRPISRKMTQELDFENLRVIPWVFAWIQCRYNLPGWYGTGEALNSIIEEDGQNLTLLKKMYHDWRFFRMLLDNAERAMARAKFDIAEKYSRLAEKGFHDQIAGDYLKARHAILLIKEQNEILGNNPTIQKSIQLRNPYTDVLNLLQIELLDRFRRSKKEESKQLKHALFLSINGIAAAMQSTG